MAKISSKKVYEEAKKNVSRNKKKYKEDIHCQMVVDVFSSATGSDATFCEKAVISEHTLKTWRFSYPVFKECYDIAKMMAKKAWELEGEMNKHDAEFNMEYWEKKGDRLFRAFKKDRVSPYMSPDKNPYEQYKELLKQSQSGEFSAPEIKQLMESINIGIRSYETYKLEEEVEDMKDALEKMRRHSVETSTETSTAKKRD